MTAPHILVVDDEPDIRELVRDILIDEAYSVAVAADGGEAKQQLRARRPDLILLDIWMPDVDGITLLREWAESKLDVPIVMMSGHGTVETAVEATRLGAYEYIEKPLSLAKLLLIIKRALETAGLRKENVDLKVNAHEWFEPLGKSKAMVGVRQQGERASQHNAWVLITGEPGTGKERFARYLHGLRADSHEGVEEPFVDVRVASLSEGTSAKELFGFEAGDTISYGRLERAEGGTIFFDEIGDMDAMAQARLLSCLESKSFYRVGGDEPIALRTQIIAATHKDLVSEIAAGHFREDLYYRLNVVPIRLPSLRERQEDIPELLSHYIDYFSEQESLSYRTMSTEAKNYLRHYDWPGNVRELINLVQRLLILGADEVIGLDEVKRSMGVTVKTTHEDEGEVFVYGLPLREAREHFEKKYLTHQLKKAGGSVGKAAKLAGVERTHLYRKIRALGIEH